MNMKKEMGKMWASGEDLNLPDAIQRVSLWPSPDLLWTVVIVGGGGITVGFGAGGGGGSGSEFSPSPIWDNTSKLLLGSNGGTRNICVGLACFLRRLGSCLIDGDASLRWGVVVLGLDLFSSEDVSDI